MKKLLYSLVLVLFGTTAIAQQQHPVDYCYDFAELAEAVAVARDSGIYPDQSVRALVQSGLSIEEAILLVESVYFDGRFMSPLEINTVTFNYCIQQTL